MVGCAVAEEADADLIAAAQLGRQASTGADAEAAADNAVGAEDAHRHIGDVHGSALAATIAGFLAHDLGHHAVELAALGQTVSVAAVCAGDVVVVAQGRASADGHAFLADVEVG